MAGVVGLFLFPNFFSMETCMSMHVYTHLCLSVCTQLSKNIKVVL